jgi:hypothetical protein
MVHIMSEDLCAESLKRNTLDDGIGCFPSLTRIQGKINRCIYFLDTL